MSPLKSLLHPSAEDKPLQAARIEDYAMIGDLQTGALVCKSGSVDWLCWPTFSDHAVFAGLLGTSDHGFFQIRPAKDEAITGEQWRYVPGTLIAEKTWTTLDGEVMVSDFMPPRGKNSDIVRIVKGVRGSVKMRMEVTFRFDYGRTVPWVTSADHHLRAINGPHLIVLRTEAPLHGEGLCTASDFTVEEGQSICFQLSYGSSTEEEPASFDAYDAYRDTVNFWEEWMAKNQFQARPEHRDAVERSLITLKAMTYQPSGGLVAALTAGLPERIGGERNWDYRYCWIRDAAFTLLVLLHAGFTEEAMAWRGWLLRAIAGSPEQFRAVYGLKGEQLLTEWCAEWLPGYENSRPVRIGNAAVEQLQLDNFGDLITALSRTPVGKDDMLAKDMRSMVTGLLRYLAKVWHEPDNGIWETRGKREHFVHSKLMAWVAFDRAISTYEQRHLTEDDPDRDKNQELVEEWRRNREELRAEILEKGFDKERNTFTQAYGSKRLDAATLRIPLVGFLPGDDPRVLGTIDAIEKNLMQNGLLLRYDTAGDSDGLPSGEGAFLACSFWYVGALHVAGRRDEASAFFLKLLGLRNEVGLLSEEYDLPHGRQLGNFPQALSHLTLCHAAMILADAEGPWNGHTQATGRKQS
ncbi:glycoside hydrolase family 15 protein [Terriglobus aquaticus]|uniref:Glycoside hydrolase family 15 protein n=1 Tax=Terriglobus aquaticus TaxID=940139 RepID=A0ABW9KI01_9BACT|nr:glycoside hydrolase family 15 protein [Terriglobus aquaticus]